jgi:putative hemolysin
MVIFVLVAFGVYMLLVMAERALVEASPHDIEALNESEGPATRRALAAVAQLRPALATLLLARIFLKVLCTVLLVSMILRSKVFVIGIAMLLEWGKLPSKVIWVAVSLAIVLPVSGLFYYLKHWQKKPVNVARTLVKLGGFILFWRRALGWLVSNENKTPAELDKGPLPEHPPQELSLKDVGDEEQQEIELLKSIVRFADVTVHQVMQPRSSIIALPLNASFAEVLSTVRESEFSRLPVYSGSLDSIRGMLYVKDLLPHLEKGADFRWQSLVKPRVLFVAPDKQGIELLEDFKKKKIHLAIVRGEGNVTAGLVTLEDVLEEVTGDIRDEFDKEMG